MPTTQASTQGSTAQRLSTLARLTGCHMALILQRSIGRSSLSVFCQHLRGQNNSDSCCCLDRSNNANPFLNFCLDHISEHFFKQHTHVSLSSIVSSFQQMHDLWQHLKLTNSSTCRRDGKAITLSHDALLVALVSTAPHVKQAADDKLRPVSVELAIAPDNTVTLSVSPSKVNPGAAASTGNVFDDAAGAATQGIADRAQTAPAVADNSPAGTGTVTVPDGEVKADPEDADMTKSTGDNSTAVGADAGESASASVHAVAGTASAEEAAADTEERAAQAVADQKPAADTKDKTAVMDETSGKGETVDKADTAGKYKTGTNDDAASKPAGKGKQAGPYAPGAGKRSDLTFLDPMNKADCPPKAIALAAGELVLRIREEKRRRKAGGLTGKSQLPMLRMSGNSPGRDLPSLKFCISHIKVFVFSVARIWSPLRVFSNIPGACNGSPS